MTINKFDLNQIPDMMNSAKQYATVVKKTGLIYPIYEMQITDLCVWLDGAGMHYKTIICLMLDG